MSMGALTISLKAAAMARGLLLSVNQDIRLLVNGAAEELDSRTLLWRKDPPCHAAAFLFR